MWQSSPKPERDDKKGKDVVRIAVLGFAGLLMEAVGFWLLFSWFTATPRSLEDPKLLAGGVVAFLGFVVLTRWLAAVVKALVK